MVICSLMWCSSRHSATAQSVLLYHSQACAFGQRVTSLAFSPDGAALAVAAWGGLLALFRQSSSTSIDAASAGNSTSTMPAPDSGFGNMDQLSMSSAVSNAIRDEDGIQSDVSRLPAIMQAPVGADSPSRRAVRPRKPIEWRILQATASEQTGVHLCRVSDQPTG